MSADFTPDQKRYLEGFASGLTAARHARGGLSGGGAGEPVGPDAIHIKAQDATVAKGGKLVDQEKWKRAEHPFDAYPRLKEQAETATFPKPEDNFRWRYYGLFYVAPAQNSFMCRLRIPNGILKAHQFAGVADLSEATGGGYCHVTTRANLQFREIGADKTIAVVEGLSDLGLTARGAGADNIRNVTGTPTAGIDPQELLDTRPHAREWHFHILNDRSLYGLPRKFNVAFDGAGRIAVLEDTNDIAFQAVEVLEGAGVEPGIYYRLALGGITGHRDFARDTGIVLPPSQATKVADAIIRVFIEQGDRTNRNKARLKYVLDAWGFERYIAAVEEKLGFSLSRVAPEHVAPRPVYDRLAHIGVHPQKQEGLNWIGLALPMGKLTADQMRGVAALSTRYGDGDIRLTVWQNLLLSGIKTEDLAKVKSAIEALGLGWTTTPVRAGLIACTGAPGCKFAASDTKATATAIADHCEQALTMDQPINIHLTGCHHSCAQHYIGDIGLIGCKVPVNEEGDTVDGFHIHVGGGSGFDAAIAREIFTNIRNEDCPKAVEALLKTYLSRRASGEESFVSFAQRVALEDLKGWASEIMA